MKKLLLSLFAIVGLSLSAKAQTPNYTIEYKFEVENMAAGMCFSMTDGSHFYMWQFNTENGNMRFRPHRWNGAPACLEEKTINGVNKDGEHTVRVEITNNGTHATTYLDGQNIDERDGEFVYGRLGFRANGNEKAYYDDFVVTKAGEEVVNENFNDGTTGIFSGGEVVNGRFHHTSALGELIWQYPPSEYDSYTIEADFKVVDHSAGLAFALNGGNYYMWQFNKENKFNPHVWDPNARLIESIDLSPKGVNIVDDDMHHLTISIVNGARKAITYIDGVKVDERSGSFAYGKVGLRHDGMPDNSPESGLWDNIKVTANGEVKFEEKFDNPYMSQFNCGVVQDGKLFISGYLAIPVTWQVDEPQARVVFECDVTIEEDGLGIMQGVVGSDYQLWALRNKNGYPALRRHTWRGGGWAKHNAPNEPVVRSKSWESAPTQHLRLEQIGNMLVTYLDGYIIDRCDLKEWANVTVSDGLFGFRQDNTEKGIVDNLKVVEVSAEGEVTVRMEDDFESDERVIDGGELVEYNGSKQLRFVANNAEVKSFEAQSAFLEVPNYKWTTYAPKHRMEVPDDEVSVYTVSAIGSNSITVHKEEAGTVLAVGEGVLLYAPGEAYVDALYTNEAADNLQNELVGTITSTPVSAVAGSDETIFGLAHNSTNGRVAFIPYEESATISAQKAYLKLSSAANISALTIDDEESTGIETLNAVTRGLTDGNIYDISGKKMEDISRKGTYIINGVKVLVK